MFLFVSIIGVLIWAAFWGAIRLERTMGVAPLPDRDTAPPDRRIQPWQLADTATGNGAAGTHPSSPWRRSGHA